MWFPAFPRQAQQRVVRLDLKMRPGLGMDWCCVVPPPPLGMGRGRSEVVHFHLLGALS